MLVTLMRIELNDLSLTDFYLYPKGENEQTTYVTGSSHRQVVVFSIIYYNLNTLLR